MGNFPPEADFLFLCRLFKLKTVFILSPSLCPLRGVFFLNFDAGW